MTMPNSVPPGSQSVERMPRQRERRQSLGPVIATLARVLEQANGVPLRGAFEEALRGVLPARSVHLRDRSSPWAPKPEASSSVVALDVRGPNAESAVLEAVFDPGRRPGDWEVGTLEAAAHLATLVLEMERGRQSPAPASLPIHPARRREVLTVLVGSTPQLARLRARISRVAATDFTVLIEGESGVGKELVARQIHDLSRRRKAPFVAINCAALVETLLEAELFGIEERTATGVRGRRGKFEAADGGTLFLDEVSDLSLSAQAKLLRAIQELAVERVGATGAQPVDIRIIAATNRSLRHMVEQRLFRLDLYYRLSGLDLHVPPLRDRPADVAELARHFLARHRHTRAMRLSEAALGALATYHWPGNVRELERIIERAVAFADSNVIELEDLPPAVRGEYGQAIAPSVARQETLRAWARRYTRVILDRSGGNKRQAARVLGISTHTLQAYLKEEKAKLAAQPGAGGRDVPRPVPS
jgi:transcriptional regulator with PAS, ATPase and Fis domain